MRLCGPCSPSGTAQDQEVGVARACDLEDLFAGASGRDVEVDLDPLADELLLDVLQVLDRLHSLHAPVEAVEGSVSIATRRLDDAQEDDLCLEGSR
jgi:hypothetical protein